MSMIATMIGRTAALSPASTNRGRFGAALKQRTAPLSFPSTGANSVFVTPGYGRTVGIAMDSTVRDAKQAAPPRGELR